MEQKSEINVNEWSEIKEGKASILIPKNAKDSVFYNPVQETNRDLSVAVIQTYIDMMREKKPKLQFSVLEALSATGFQTFHSLLILTFSQPKKKKG